MHSATELDHRGGKLTSLHQGGDPGTLRVVVAGTSQGLVCGVRDHARVLSDALAEQGAMVASVWVEQPGGFSSTVRLAQQLWRRSRDDVDVIVLHYSVFAYASHGIPVGLPLLALVLGRFRAPVVLLAHELVYPWRRRGWRGAVHAATQRAALVPLVAGSDAVIVTTEDRVGWFRSRRWLPCRPVFCAPVFSNIPRQPAGAGQEDVPGRVGVFSFGAEGLDADLVTRAVAAASVSVGAAHLTMIGAPGEHGATGRRWRAAADAVGCPLTFTGVLDEAELSGELARCQVVVFADPAGPSSRKTSLAAALVHGRAVVALDGPHRWVDLVEAGAVVLADPVASHVAAALVRLLVDDVARAELASRALAFADSWLSPVTTAATVIEIARMAIDAKERGRAPGAAHRFGFSVPQSPAQALACLPVRGILLSRMVLREAGSARLRAILRFWCWHLVRRTSDRPVLVDLGASRFALPRWSQIGAMIIATGSHEPAETSFLDRLVRPGDAFIDVGANIGFYSVRCAVAGAIVAAFEPTTRAADAIDVNAALAGVGHRVRVERCAIADDDGEAWFCDGGDVGNALGSSGSGRLVPVRRLDSLAGAIAAPMAHGITVLKVDAEGADLRVLEGAKRFIDSRRPILLVEAWDGGRDLRALLERIGYSAFVARPSGIVPLDRWFWQANVIGIPSELLALVRERLEDAVPQALRPPLVLSWGIR